MRDHTAQLRYLEQTFASIAGQVTPGWKAWVVGHRSQSLPKLPNKFEFVPIDFPAEPLLFSAKTRAEHYHAVRLDKGRRVLAAFQEMQRSEVFMVVDDDDFVSARLAHFVSTTEVPSGYHINSGYIWDVEKNFIAPSNKFHTICGTSLLISVEFMQRQVPVIGSQNEALITELGSHKTVVDRALREGLPFSPVPFPGAIYRMGSSNSDSKFVAATKTGSQTSHKEKEGKLKLFERHIRYTKKNHFARLALEKSQRNIPYQKFQTEFLGHNSIPEIEMICDTRNRLPLRFPNGPVTDFPYDT
ncbi:hypothetical protein [Celeribacter sp. ULVN23_4]